MRIPLQIALILLFIANLAVAKNYTLTIDDEQHDLSLGEVSRIKVGDRYISVKLEQKDIFIYETENFSFQHPRQYSPSKTDLGDGLFQTAMMTPRGTVVMIQEYLNLNPTQLMDLMVNEVTKEEKEYGYTIESKPTSLTLSDGKVIEGRVVTSKYKGADIERGFYMYGLKDSGLFIMTQIDYVIGENDKPFIEEFLNSLKVNM